MCFTSIYVFLVYFGYMDVTLGQSSDRFLEDFPSCPLPQPPLHGSYLSVLCYSEASLWTECLNVPETPVRSNWNLTYICNQGFYLPHGRGYLNIRCQNGQWVPPPPECTDKVCSPPLDPPKGHFVGHPVYCGDHCGPPEPHLNDLSLLHLQCDQGYRATSSGIALCVRGHWVLPPSCKRIINGTVKGYLELSKGQSCELPNPPEHGTYFSVACYGSERSLECQGVPGSPARHSWTLSFQCDDGFLPSTNQTLHHSRCVNGQWTPPPPTCAVSTKTGCKVLSDPSNGRYSISCIHSECLAPPYSLVPEGYRLSILCFKGYKPKNGYTLSTCVQGLWTPRPPACSEDSEDISNAIVEREVSELQSKFSGCVLPPPPRHGRYSLYPCQGSKCQKTPAPSQIVPHLQVMSISCDFGYQSSSRANSSVLVSCDDGHWNQPFPECFRLCPNLKSTTVDMECYQGPTPVSCDGSMLPNTTVTNHCKLNHETSDPPRDLVCKADGQWSSTLPHCKPNCGFSKLGTYDIVPTIVGGQASPLGYFPWHAGLAYRRNDGVWEIKCGGTLISPYIILTAAHCVTEGSTKMEPSIIKVALGKYNRDWYMNETSDVRRDVKDIQILPNYLGKETFLDLDIALMILDSPVPVTSFVMPACVDYYNKFNFEPDMIGYVPGWGKTEECQIGHYCGDGSQTLQYTNTSFLSFRKCRDTMQHIKATPITRLTADKFCAANATYSVTQQGDSGGGITFQFNGAHYVAGVVSSRISIDNVYSFSAFTNVTHHITWIYKMISYFDSLT